MKIVLSVTIAIKDYFPKDKNIPYDKFICIFNNNNFNSKIKLSNIQTQNFFKHKVECINSNIVYNLHLLDSTKNSLIGIYQLIINFDKIKNLNVNDILTQEETAKLIIDSKTKRKLFDKITNLGDIYLILSSEIKILDKKVHVSDGRENKSLSKRGSNLDNNNLFLDFNLSPRNIKKKQIFKILKNEREALKELDDYSIFNDNNNNNNHNITDFIMDENDNSFVPNDTLRKYKSLNNKKMNNQNNIIYNELYTKNQYFENSNTQMISPKLSNTNYNFKKEDSKKTFRKKKQLSKKKVTILNLMEEKMDPALYSSCTTKERNTLELSSLFNGFKNTYANFNKMQVNHIKKNSFTSLNTHSSFKGRKKQKQIISDKNNSNFIDESDFLNNRKGYKNNNKIMVNMNKNNIIQKTISKNKVNKNCLNIFDTERYNTEHPKIDFKKLKNINNIFLQTEGISKFPDIKKQILTDNDLRKLIIEKDNSIRENFQGTDYAKNLKRGTFSPKVSLKLRFTDNTIISNDIYDKSSTRYSKEKISKRILTPKTEHIKKVSFLNNEDNLYTENEELRKKCFNLIEFYSLLTKKLKNICKNNIDYFKKVETMREKYHNLNKCKNKLIEMKNYNDSKKVKSHTHSHYEEEQLISSMLKIKIKENSIYHNIFGNFNDDINLKNKMNILISDKKEKLLNLIRNIVKFYGNISQIYDKDKVKKTMLKNLLEKYEIKEKNKTDLNYINYIHKGNNFDDKIITEVDEDKENEEEDEGDLEKKVTNNIEDNDLNIENIDNIDNASTIINNFGDFGHSYINNNDMNNNNEKNKLKELDIENTYDENLNNLIEKILIEEFPENYKTNLKFIHQGKNRYIFGNKIFKAFIKNNDVMLKEIVNDNNISECNLSLNDFYKKYCLPEIRKNKSNYIYTKKIKQKYIKIKGSVDKDDQSLEKKIKNENSTTIETDIRQYSMISKTNEVNDIRNSIFDDKCE